MSWCCHAPMDTFVHELKSKNIIECSKVTKSAEEKLQKLGVELKISKAI